MDYLCSGAVVPGVMVVRRDLAREKPELVAKYLAVYLRGIAWVKQNLDEGTDMLLEFCSEGGVEISDEGAAAEFALRPTFTLPEQVALMNRDAGK